MKRVQKLLVVPQPAEQTTPPKNPYYLTYIWIHRSLLKH